MRTFPHRSLSSFLLILLSACSGDGSSPPASTLVPPPPQGKAVTTTFQPHAGLEIFAPGINDASIVAAPTGSITDNTDGYTLSSKGGFKLTYSRDGGDNTVVNFDVPRTGDVTRYTGCSKCFGASYGMDKVEFVLNGDGATSLSYTTYGTWQTGIFAYFDGTKGAFAFGTAPTTDRPTTGKADYAGGAAGFAAITGDARYALNGHVALTADFGANTLAGAITGVTAARLTTEATWFSAGTPGTANDISLNGALNETAFFGVAKPSAATAGSIINFGASSGSFGGSFYGPKAAELGGTLAMSSTGTNVIMSFGAKR